ncbi:MAG: N-acetyltransferase [Phycisphaerales bacterium]
MSELLIRPEAGHDEAAIRHINEQAFGQPAEARLVDALRAGGGALLSLVAERDGMIVGHVLFSPAAVVSAEAETHALALAPIAVLPGYQKQGVGSALIEQSLAELRDASHGLVIVLGHPDYYPRFGFVPASRFRISCPFDVPDEAFMALELREGAAPQGGGVVRYHAAFSDM